MIMFPPQKRESNFHYFGFKFWAQSLLQISIRFPKTTLCMWACVCVCVCVCWYIHPAFVSVCVYDGVRFDFVFVCMYVVHVLYVLCVCLGLCL